MLVQIEHSQANPPLHWACTICLLASDSTLDPPLRLGDSSGDRGALEKLACSK